MAHHIHENQEDIWKENRGLLEAAEKARIWNEIKKKMDEGQLNSLSANFCEMERLVDPESAEGIKFQSYMEQLTRKLLPGWDFRRYPIQFLISDVRKEVNAGIIAANEPAFCFFTKALLQMVADNENKLLHVLGHELSHEVFREAVGHSLRTTKPEEIMVNMAGIWWMYSNGINPQPALDLAQDLRALAKARRHRSAEDRLSDRFNRVDTVFDIAISLADEHPTPDFNVNLINGEITALGTKVGGFADTANIDVPDEMQALFNGVKYLSPLDRAKAALNPPFDEMSPPQQLGFIEEQAMQINEAFVTDRVYDLLEMLESVQNDLDDQSKRVGTGIVRALKEYPDVFPVLYRRVNTNLFGKPEFAPVEPVFGHFMSVMQNAANAASYEEFRRNCNLMLEEERNLAPYPLSVIDWPAVFALPRRQDLQKAAAAESRSGPLLAQLRGEISQASLARALGVRREIIERWENEGITLIPNIPDLTLDDIINELSRALGLIGPQIQELRDAFKADLEAADRRGNVPLPWEDQVRWAINAMDDGDEGPAISLVKLGVEDPRLYYGIPDRLLRRVYVGIRLQNRHLRPFQDDPFLVDYLYGFSPKEALLPMVKVSQGEKLSQYHLSFGRDGGRIRFAQSGEPNWNAEDAVRLILRKRERASLDRAQEQLKAAAYQFNNTLPFTDEAGFREWFARNRSDLIAPVIAAGVEGGEMARFKAGLTLWYMERPLSREKILDIYRASLAKGESRGTAKYDRRFLKFVTEQIQPFEKQAGEVAKMLDAQLNREEGVERERGRELVRAFFLNPPEQPGLRRIMPSRNSIMLAATHPYVTFLTAHPGVFTIKEKAAILKDHVIMPEDPIWWNRILETEVIYDLPSLLQFIRTTEEFERALEPSNQTLQDGERTKSGFRNVLPPYMTGIMGYNYAGTLDLASLLENPPQSLQQICASAPYDFDDLPPDMDDRFLASLINPETAERFMAWIRDSATLINDPYDGPDKLKDDLQEGNWWPAEFFERYLERHSLLYDPFLHSNIEGAPFASVFDRTLTFGSGVDFATVVHFLAPVAITIDESKTPPALPVAEAGSIRDLVKTHIAEQRGWPDELHRRARIYRNLDHLDLFPTYRWQEDCRNELLNRIKEETNSDRRLHCLRIILGGEALKDPAMRSAAAQLWIQTIKENLELLKLGKHGRDDGSLEYARVVQPYIDWAEKNVPAGERYGLFVALADGLETQREISYRLYDSFRASGKDFEETDKYFRLGEAVFVYASQTPADREILLDYLMSDPTDDVHRQFGEWISKVRHKLEKEAQPSHRILSENAKKSGWNGFLTLSLNRGEKRKHQTNRM